MKYAYFKCLNIPLCMMVSAARYIILTTVLLKHPNVLPCIFICHLNPVVTLLQMLDLKF